MTLQIAVRVATFVQKGIHARQATAFAPLKAAPKIVRLEAASQLVRLESPAEVLYMQTRELTVPTAALMATPVQPFFYGPVWTNLLLAYVDREKFMCVAYPRTRDSCIKYNLTILRRSLSFARILRPVASCTFGLEQDAHRL